MKVLVIGAGGREHALVWKIAQSPRIKKIYCAPGNAGIAREAECVPIKPTDIEALASFAANNNIDLTVVGPEAPLMQGIVDLFEAKGLPIFGPSKDPARLEGSKSFAKRLMQTSGIPTAAFWVCDSPTVARARLADYYALHGPDARVVVKADGLAAGKGVIVASSLQEAEQAIHQLMEEKVFGEAGTQVVIEEHLSGEEASIMAITDGSHIVPLLPSQDHKRAFDNDQGPNTGGMGAVCPVPILPPNIVHQVIEQIVRPAIEAIRDLGIPYRGTLYAGVMVTPEGPKCIEFNSRFGDPETQVVLPLLESDLLDLLQGAVECTLDQVEAKWKPAAAVTVVAASEGYPGPYTTGKPIRGIEEAEALGCLVFHAGTRRVDGSLVTDGGRVLNVTGLGADVREAAQLAYKGISRIFFEGMHYRKDIAARNIR